jgi:DNA polymerase-2
MIVAGWLLDVFTHEKANGVVLWLLGDDGQRYRFEQAFPITFYAAGPPERLRALWRFLQSQPEPARLTRTERRDLFSGPLVVLAVEVTHPANLPRLFRQVSQVFPDLTFYDTDIHLALRHTATFGVFPTAHCEIETDMDNQVKAIEPLNTPWELDPAPLPLRILTLELDTNPSHAAPARIIVSYDRCRYLLPLEPAQALITGLGATLKRYDPDLILTAWGDTWLLPHMLKLWKEHGCPLPLNREPVSDVIHRKEHSYFSYGQIIYRGRQVCLLGRWHIDRYNALLWNDYGLEGVLEMARVTGLPIQDAARLSPGTGISSMQFLTALRRGILIPWHKHQAEYPKTALELLRADMGGIVYQPIPGLHCDVAGIDFVSMYPGIMVRFNISPEVPRSQDDLTPAPGEPGIIPQTLAPLLKRRLEFKSALASLSKWDARRKPYQARASADKWLLVTCFGYLGYKNARFGRIEAHEAITAYGREALLRAKEAAEESDFTVLHMYVDGLWVQKAGCQTVEDFQKLLEATCKRTGLPIALDGIYRWIVFLSSKVDARVPVPNRYFGVFQDGTIKARGIEARRRDTPAFIAETQMQILEILAHAPDANQLQDCLPAVTTLVKKKIASLRAGRVPLEDLLIGQRLSRELEKYRTPSPAARAARQLVRVGKQISPGQRVRFLLTRGRLDVYAWDLPDPPDPRMVDVPRYHELLLRAVQTILEPIAQHYASKKQSGKESFSILQ